MSIMAFELPIMEMAFALGEFEFKVHSRNRLSVYRSLKLLLLESIFEFEFSLLMATFNHRNLGQFAASKLR